MQAFNKLDKDKSGYIEVQDLKGVYNATKHPDVIQGKKTEDQVLMEFLETFETHHNIRNNDAPDHIVTKEEFIEYYNNISSSMDNDEHFVLMMNNAWKINEGDKAYGKGWSNQEASPMKSSPAKKPFRVNDPASGSKPKPTPTNPESFHKSSEVVGPTISPTKGRASPQKQGPEMSHSDKQLCEMFRKKLASRGARGISGLQR